MTPEKWNKIKELFSGAQDFPADQRADFLNHACGDDPEIKSEVEKLLDSYREDDPFMENSAVAELASLFDEDGVEGLLDDPDSPRPRFEVGMLLNERYKLVRLLGRGGMGEVYLANDNQLNRNVALKVLHPDLVSSKESLRRFELEAQAVSKLNHPHIMTIYELGNTDDGAMFFVGEHIDGLTLNRLIGAHLKLDTALDIAMQVSSALSAAHEAGITHRDIKPENIMVRRDGYVKVLDFGLAKLAQEKKPPGSAGSEEPTYPLLQTRPGSIMGTAAYMSPEQARGKHIDARTDIWSLGVVIYEMLTGRKPFSGDTAADIIVSVLSTEPAPLVSKVHDLPPELAWLVSKALSKDVDGRYQTAKELRTDLDKIKRRIEFEETLSRSAGGDSGDDFSEGATVISSVEDAAPTFEDAARPTRGGRDDSAGHYSFWSSPGVSSVFQQARAHQFRSSIFALALLALVSSAAYLFFVASGSNRDIDSIAVLPFENLSGNPDLAYVSDGLSESLIDRLSELPQLKVISRNSSFKFRGANIDVRDVASQLGVRAILTGSVAQVGDELVIRFDIIDGTDDRQITGGQFRRKASDILRVQNEIAQAASEQLRLKLTDPQSKRLDVNVTENSDAYRYYLSGLVEQNGPRDIESRALEYFEQAVKLDPDFAAAHAEIAWIYWSRANGIGDPHELMPKARASTERALAIDPNLAKAHVLMATVNEYQFDWQGAEREYKRAIELSPNLDFARNNYAFFLSVMGRQDEALAELEQQRVRDPINRRMALLQKGIILVQAKRFDDALQAYQEAQVVEPGTDVPEFALGYAYAGNGLFSEAAGHLRKSVEMLGGDNKYSQPLVYLAAAYAKIPEKRGEARALLTRIEAMGGYTSPALLAAVYAALDDNDKAMELLEQAYIKRDLLLRYVGTGYEYDSLRVDPRFADLLRRIGFSEVK